MNIKEFAKPDKRPCPQCEINNYNAYKILKSHLTGDRQIKSQKV